MAEENGLNGHREMQEAITSKSQEEEKSSGTNPKQEGDGKDEKQEKPKPVPFTKPFSFADSKDVLLMILGTIGAIGNGVSIPLMTILMGQTIDVLG